MGSGIIPSTAARTCRRDVATAATTEVVIQPTIVDRYVAGAVGRPFLGVVVLLVGVFVAYSLARFLGEANEGLLSAQAVMRLAALKTVIALEVLLPIALYIGCIVGLGRLYSDWEVVAFRAGGVAETRLMLPAMLLATVIALCTLLLSLYARPWAYAELYASEAQAEAETDLARLPAGQFHVLADQGRTVFIGRREAATGRLDAVFLRGEGGDDLEVISAAHGDIQPAADSTDWQLTLADALIYRRGPDGEQVVARLGELALVVPGLKEKPRDYRVKSASTGQLLSREGNEERAELQWRLSNGVSTLLLAAVALPLSRTRPRSGRYARILIAVVLYALYFNAIGMARSAVEQGVASHLWWAPLALAVLLVGVLVAQRRTGV
ncbi:MAG: LPS export ABC transporter permease LptF [Pseudomonadales bacterium]|nr:LPS export ABC transporter permease LptF [Pseudomonadales bacterium]